MSRRWDESCDYVCVVCEWARDAGAGRQCGGRDCVELLSATRAVGSVRSGRLPENLTAALTGSCWPMIPAGSLITGVSGNRYSYRDQFGLLTGPIYAV